MSANRAMLTAKRARELLDYDPATGVLRNRTNRSSRARAVEVAGNVGPRGYRRICLDGRIYPAHRLAFLLQTGRWPHEIDHRNGVRDDNRWLNLREVSRQENCWNMAGRKHRRCPLGRTGVSWNQRRGRWYAYIDVDGRRIHLGSYKNVADAVRAREDAEREYGFSPRHGMPAGFQPPDYPSQSVTPSQPLQDKASSDFQSVTRSKPVTDGNPLNPLGDKACDGVTDQNPLAAEGGGQRR